MLLTDTAQPFTFDGVPEYSDFRSAIRLGHHRSNSTASIFSQASSARSNSTVSSASSGTGLKLKDVAKQYGFGMHVENWREDMQPVRQYLPMQHIIGSLKRDRDEQVRYFINDNSQSKKIHRARRQTVASAASAGSNDSFLDALSTPKRRRISDSSKASQYSAQSDPDRKFSYQVAGHASEDISEVALPGPNHVLNLATITADERDIFAEYAPKHLDDSQLLMNEVLGMQKPMVTHKSMNDFGEYTDEHAVSSAGLRSPIIPPERDAEVRKAFEDFVDLSDNNRFIAKL